MNIDIRSSKSIFKGSGDDTPTRKNTGKAFTIEPELFSPNHFNRTRNIEKNISDNLSFISNSYYLGKVHSMPTRVESDRLSNTNSDYVNSPTQVSIGNSRRIFDESSDDSPSENNYCFPVLNKPDGQNSHRNNRHTLSSTKQKSLVPLSPTYNSISSNDSDLSIFRANLNPSTLSSIGRDTLKPVQFSNQEQTYGDFNQCPVLKLPRLFINSSRSNDKRELSSYFGSNSNIMQNPYENLREVHSLPQYKANPMAESSKEEEEEHGNSTFRSRGIDKIKKTIRFDETNITNTTSSFSRRRLSRLRRYSKQELKTKLASIGWIMSFPTTLKKEIFKTVKTRRLGCTAFMRAEYPRIIELIQEYLKLAAFEQITNMHREKKNMAKLIDSDQQISTKELVSIGKECLISKVKQVMEQINQYTSKNALNPEICSFLASVSENNCTLPSRFYTVYELKRINTSEFGTLKGMTEHRSKMIIGVTVLVKVLIYQVLLNPWSQAQSFVKNISKKELTRNNLAIFASLLYLIFDDSVKRNLHKISNNKKTLDAIDKIKPILGGKLNYVQKGSNPDAQSDLEDEAISGLYTRKQLACLFTSFEAEIEELRNLLDIWLDSIYQSTHRYYKYNRKEVTRIKVYL